MQSSPHIVHLLEPAPPTFTASVYLAGPGEAGAWRPQAVRLLAAAGFDGVIFVPEPRSLSLPGLPAPFAAGDLDRQLAWETESLRLSDAILFFVPQDAPADPLLSLADEQWGAWKRSGKIVFAATGAAASHHRWSASRFRVPQAYSLAEAVQILLPLVRPGAARTGGERAMPLNLWRSPALQRWYHALRDAGNRLDDFEVEWSYRPRVHPGRPPLVFAFRPKVWVRDERRHKASEVVVARADVSATVLYHPGKDLWQTEVLLIREFRSAVANVAGFVWELPGGSAEHAADREHDPRVTAAREIEQETGLRLSASALEAVPFGVRQVAATLLIHRAHLFRAALDADQLAFLRAAEIAGQSHGANPGERCYVIVRSVGDLMSRSELDWGQVGMILSALAPLYESPLPIRLPPVLP